jgi:hypothetical protein
MILESRLRLLPRVEQEPIRHFRILPTTAPMTIMADCGCYTDEDGTLIWQCGEHYGQLIEVENG